MPTKLPTCGSNRHFRTPTNAPCVVIRVEKLLASSSSGIVNLVRTQRLSELKLYYNGIKEL